MIKVFNPTDTSFTTNGEAVILPTLALVHKTDNGDFYLELVSGIEYAEYLDCNNIIVAPTPQGEQAFRIKQILEKTEHKISVIAKHLFYDSENYLIEDSYVVSKDCNDALDHLNLSTDTESPFITLSDVTTINSFRCIRKSLFEAVGVVLERWGGHLVRDNYNLQIKESIGADNGVTVQYRKNLKEITVSEDWTNVCTKLLPVGKNGLTIGYVYSAIQYDLPYTKTVSFSQDIDAQDYDDIDQYQAALIDDLRAQADAYLESHQIPSLSYTLSANMDKITDIGDTVTVFDERLGIDITTHVLSFTYDCIQDKYTEVTFGTVTPTLEDLLSTIESNIDYSINENNQVINVTLQEAITDAENRIFAAMSNSYVIYQGNQILVVDSLPAETATNVIRINSAGIAFSNSGINGNFVTCWTIDGTFNAQAINVINFTADMIKGGTLKLGANLNEYGILEIFDEGNNLISRFDKDGLKMYAQDDSYLLINTEVGFAGFDRDDNKIFWVNEDEFHQKKSVVEEEITLCDKVRFIPIEIPNSAGTDILYNGIGLVSTI